MDPRMGFSIGSLSIRYYSLLIILGAIIAALIAAWQAKKHDRDPELVVDMLPWLLIGGIIGARLWHVFTPGVSDGITTAEYFKNPILILKTWEGGLGIPGAVIGGALALWIYTKVRKLSFLEWADYIAPGLLVAQGIGRWGNYLNQELYGKPSNLPWAITIEEKYRIAGFKHIEKYHPLFFYEFALNFLAAGLLLIISRVNKKKLYKGDIFLLYLVFYPAIRFSLEFVRLVPSLSSSGININQTFMLIMMILAIIALILRHTVFKPKQVDALEETDVVDGDLDDEHLELFSVEELDEVLNEELEEDMKEAALLNTTESELEELEDRVIDEIDDTVEPEEPEAPLEEDEDAI